MSRRTPTVIDERDYEILNGLVEILDDALRDDDLETAFAMTLALGAKIALIGEFQSVKIVVPSKNADPRMMPRRANQILAAKVPQYRYDAHLDDGNFADEFRPFPLMSEDPETPKFMPKKRGIFRRRK